MIGGRLDRHLAARFSVMILIAIASFVVIFVSVDAFDHFSRWVDRDVTPGTFLRYYFYGLPYIVVLVMPIAVLLSSLFLVSSMARRNELIAMRAAGISIPRIFLPLIVVGGLASVLELGLGDFVVANANHMQNMVKRVEIDGREPVDYARRSSFARRSPGGAILDVGFFDGATESMTDVTIEWFDDSSRVTRRLDATRIQWLDSAWVAMDVEERVFGPSGAVAYAAADTMPLPEITETPSEFGSRQKTPAEMSFLELLGHIERVRRAGGDPREDLVELWLKLFFPLSNLIMVIVGAPLAIRNARSGRATHAGLAILLAFLFFSLVRFGQTLGHKGALPPLMAASMGDIIFLAIGLVLLFRSR